VSIVIIQMSVVGREFGGVCQALQNAESRNRHQIINHHSLSTIPHPIRLDISQCILRHVTSVATPAWVIICRCFV
jgi:hypothetical protein